MSITIYHNPNCGTSRKVLGILRDAGIETTIVEYMKNPLDQKQLAALAARMDVPVRALLRSKEAIFEELGLGAAALLDDILLDAIATHPILLNRPIVDTPTGTRLCRPAELVFDLIPSKDI